MTKPSLRLAFGLLAVALVTTHFLGAAHAQSSLGIGTNDGMAPSTGPFAHILMWINLRQQEFYRALAGAMKAMREDGQQAVAAYRPVLRLWAFSMLPAPGTARR